MAALRVVATVLFQAVLAEHLLAAHPAAELLGLLAAAEDLGPRPVERLAVLLVGQTIGRQAEEQQEQQEQTLRGQAGRVRGHVIRGRGRQAGQGSCDRAGGDMVGGGSGDAAGRGQRRTAIVPVLY